MDDPDIPHELSLEVVYADLHMLQLEAVVGAGHWQGRVRAYTVSQDIAAFAAALEQFIDGAVSFAEFNAGADKGIGLIALRFYRIDRSGHIACHSVLASGEVPTDHRPEQVSRFAVEFGAEAWAVLPFSRQLAELAVAGAGRASLAIDSRA